MVYGANGLNAPILVEVVPNKDTFKYHNFHPVPVCHVLTPPKLGNVKIIPAVMLTVKDTIVLGHHVLTHVAKASKLESLISLHHHKTTAHHVPSTKPLNVKI
jgi:hypothetical protein